MKYLLFVLTFFVLIPDSSAQDKVVAGPGTVTLNVDSGLALRLIMTDKLRFKQNEPVRAKITDPVFAFDREVIPPGSEVDGHIIGFRRPARWIRIWSMMGGN